MFFLLFILFKIIYEIDCFFNFILVEPFYISNFILILLINIKKYKKIKNLYFDLFHMYKSKTKTYFLIY
jgi:hypothetical protein